MLKLAAALLFRVGLVFLIMAALVRLVRMPNQADVVVDDLAILINGLLVLVSGIYLRLTRGRDSDPVVPSQRTPSDLTSVRRIQR